MSGIYGIPSHHIRTQNSKKALPIWQGEQGTHKATYAEYLYWRLATRTPSSICYISLTSRFGAARRILLPSFPFKHAGPQGSRTKLQLLPPYGWWPESARRSVQQWPGQSPGPVRTHRLFL